MDLIRILITPRIRKPFTENSNFSVASPQILLICGGCHKDVMDVFADEKSLTIFDEIVDQ